jgi:nucleoside-diphosphate-sugar epimerase
VQPIAPADLDHILNHTRGLWEEVRCEQIFITGGTGFFGHWLLESFLWINQRLKLGSRATVLTRSPQSFIKKTPHLAQDKAVSLLAGDVRTFNFPAGTFSHIIHAATESSAKLNAEDPLLMLNSIVTGTRRVLDFSLACGAKKFLLTSSGAVYGKQPADLTHIPEDYPGAPDPLDPQSAYGQGKRMAEHLCALYAQRPSVEMKIARCFAFVGPHLPLDAHFAIGNFIRDALNGGPIVVKGDGTPRRSYLYAADLAIWLWTILFNGKNCQAYNVGSDKDVSIAELADIVVRNSPGNIKVQIGKEPVPGVPPERYVPSVERAKEELGLIGYFSLNSTVLRTIQFGF